MENIENEKKMIEVEVDAKDYEKVLSMLKDQGLSIVEDHEAEDEEEGESEGGYKADGEEIKRQFRGMTGTENGED